jgi:hypothetical protein
MSNIFRKLAVTALLFVSLILLVSQFEIIVPTSSVINTQSVFLHMADVIGVTAAIPANPYNILAKQLSDKQAALNARQAELDQQQASLKNQAQQTQLPTAGVKSGLAIVVVVTLIIDAFLLFINLYLEKNTKLAAALNNNDHPQATGYGSA